VASRNNKHNQHLSASISGEFHQALKLYWSGDCSKAELLYKTACENKELQTHWRRFTGEKWSALNDLRLHIHRILYGPCECWYCSFTPAQKRDVRREVPTKYEALATAYPSDGHLFTGAYAEVVFGIRFGLRINQVVGFDGGIDYEVPCGYTESKRITIDMKGTTHGHSRAGTITSSFPHQREWCKRTDHAYVLLQVVDRAHVFFRGFAFGDDPVSAQAYFIEKGGHGFWEIPKPIRTLNELEELVSKPGTTIESENQPDQG